MKEQIGNFFKLVIKYGGANLVIFLVAAWYFNTYFYINPADVSDLLSWLLRVLFFETVYVLIVSRVIWTLEKFRDYREGKTMSSDMNGKSVSAAAKDIGLETVITIVEKATTLREKIADTKDEKKKTKLENELAELEVELAKI